MSSPTPTQGLRTSARSPGSIANEQHHDLTAVQRSGNGMIGAIDRVLADSTTKEPIQDNQPLWVVNTAAAVAYLFVGKDSDCPATVDNTNGLALPVGAGLLVFTDRSDDPQQSVVVKSSASTVHVTVLKQ